MVTRELKHIALFMALIWGCVLWLVGLSLGGAAAVDWAIGRFGEAGFVMFPLYITVYAGVTMVVLAMTDGVKP